MPYLSPDEQFADLKSKVSSTLMELFPVEGRGGRVVLKNVEVDDNLDTHDLRSQRVALQEGKTWAVPVYGDAVLEREGQEIDRKRVLLMHLPKTTDRFGYIVKGREYQALTQFRQKSGVYHRTASNGALLAEFNLANRDQFANGRTFKVRFDPEEAVYYLQHGNSNIPLYHLLKGAGVSDRELEQRWGAAIVQKNRERASAEQVYSRFYKAVNKKQPADPMRHAGLFRELLGKTRLRADTTKKTLGAEFETVDNEVLLRATENLLDMSKGRREDDPKTSLEFQSVHTIDDFIDGRLKRAAPSIRRKLANALASGRTRNVRRVVKADPFDRAVQGYFTSDLTVNPEQTNPLEMLAGQLKTTIMGEQGGYKSAHVVSEESKLISPSHLGFLDPIHTPESDKTGVTLSLPLGVKKVGNELETLLVDARTGRTRRMQPADVLDQTVAFPDQYERKGKKLVARHAKVKATRGGEVVTVPASEVDYVLPSPRSLFGVASNLVPFLQNNQGNRAMTAAKQQEQAVPLEHREAPLVQVEMDRGGTFEQALGLYASRRAPVAGVVKTVKKDAVIINDGDKDHEVQIYRNFPLNGTSLYDMDVQVKKGDQVEKGQLLADSTFTKDGTLALGTNLRTAYIPFMGYNFEDGIVISEAAARKLASRHLYKKSTARDADTILSRKTFLAEYPYVFGKGQLSGVGEDGIVKPGTILNEGDPLIMVLRKPPMTKARKQIREFRRGRPDKYRDRSVVWDKPYQGEVTEVVRKGKDVTVYVKTREPAQIGDKVVGRHGNKGVITRIIPVSEMPWKEGENGEKEHVEIALNPLGVPGRINLGQILETAAGKVAEKRGKPYGVRNFEAEKDYLAMVKEDLAAEGLQDRDELIDPRTGKPFPNRILAGNQYIVKLKHQVGKKVSARAGGPGAPYDINHAPAGGAPHGGQALGELGMYSMLAHGARENLHEMFAYKSSRNHELWDALREGTPLPPPKVPFAYEKFLSYLNAMRVDARKHGNSLTLVPFTEEQVKSMSAGELKDPGLVVRGKDLRPLKGGLFDEDITGGMLGDKWAHFKLAEPMPNPLFEDAVKKLLNITRKRYADIVAGRVEVKGKRGGEAIKALLEDVNVAEQREAITAKLATAKGATRSKLHKQLRILKALEANNLDPTVYMMESVPVVPPIMRPVTVKDDGSLSSNDLNYLYKGIAASNDVLRSNKRAGLPAAHMETVRSELYDGVKALMGVGAAAAPGPRDYQGVLKIISGDQPKEGYFQKRVMKRRQDFSARSIIIPEPGMDLDELGVPEKVAWSLYQPFIERDLARAGWKMLDAINEVKARGPAAEKALERAVQERPILLKRDPALHMFNVMAFKPRLVKGSAIEIHPLVVSGYNADFDGDAMSVYLPLTSKAVKEAHGMYPSKNLFSSSTGAVMHTPGHEALLGLYLASKPGKRTRHTFKTGEDARAAWRRGRIDRTDIIHVAGHETTVGRLDIERHLPPELRETGKKPVSQMRVYDKGTTKKVLTAIAKKNPDHYGKVANAFKDIGNEHTFDVGFSIGLDDFEVINRKERDSMMQAAEAQADRIRQGPGSKQRKDERVVKIFQDLDDSLDRLNTEHLAQNPTNISRMVESGARGKPSQLKQIISSPVLVMDAKNRVVPSLIPRSYSEGMDVASYWTTLHGARKGTIQKVQGVKDPGYISKQVMNSTMNQLVTERDCGTTEGIFMSVDDSDILDRYTVQGTLITPKVVADARKRRQRSLKVRSPLRCKSSHGICQKCMGLSVNGHHHDVGTNVGVLAGQAIGEPATQLSLNVFHTGGLAKGRGSKSVNAFHRLTEILRLPKNLPDAAPLALESGTVTKVERAPQGGEYVTVGRTRHYLPAAQARAVKRGQPVRKGAPLTDGVVDPRNLLSLRGLEAVQDHLTDELAGVMGTVAPVKRRNLEVVVKALTNVTHIDDAGDHPEWVPGDAQPYSAVQAYNRKPGTKPVKHTPYLKGVNVLPHEMQEDWMARLNYTDLSRTLTEAAREGWRSNIHGFHPVPGAAYAAEFGQKQKAVKPGEPWRGEY